MQSFIKFSIKSILLILVAAIIVLAINISIILFSKTKVPGGLSLVIKQGDTITKVVNKLHEIEIIRSPKKFIKIAVFLGYDKKIKAGHYDFGNNISLFQVLRKVISGQVNFHKLTIIEGKTLSDVSKSIINKTNIVVSPPDKINALNNLNDQSLEGLLFPDTYYYRVGEQDVTIFQMAYDRMNKILSEHWESRDQELLYNNRYEALILASIVEKETSVASEKPLVAEVFLNRIQAGMRLQADPTVIYGLGENFSGTLTKKNLKEMNSYNTYRVKGLPPTPICFPGQKSIDAVFNPTNKGYYYFVSNGLGTHIFTKTLKEHNEAVKYVKILKDLRKRVFNYLQEILKVKH